MIPPEKIIRPEDVDPTHNVVDVGHTISQPECTQCGAAVYGNYKDLLTPCEGRQQDLFRNVG